MPRARKTVDVPRRESRSYVEKAKQFEATASTALADELFDAALLNAIHAGISAADAVSVALSGRRSTDADHGRAVDLLQEVGEASPEIADKVRQLRTLLSRKNTVEYESRRTRKQEASDSVQRASRLVVWADELVRNAGW